VAHDRHLLKATADTLWLVADGEVNEFDGDLDDYKQWAKEYASKRNNAHVTKTPAPAPVLAVAIAPIVKVPAKQAPSAKNAPNTPPLGASSNDRKDQKKQDADARQRLANTRKPLEKKLAELDAKLKTLTAEKQNIETWMSDESAYTEEKKPQLQDMLKRQGEVKTAIEDCEWEWMSVSEKLEAVGV
jgi:ATP-binding cassette subfamily F protein 3